MDLQCRNAKNETLLWLALTNTNQDDSTNDLMIFEPQENVVANKLVKKGLFVLLSIIMTRILIFNSCWQSNIIFAVCANLKYSKLWL